VLPLWSIRGGRGRGGTALAKLLYIGVSSQLSGLFFWQVLPLVLVLRIKRYREWWAVIREEFGGVSFVDKLRLMRGMLKVLGGKRGEEVVRKYRSCCRCLLFDRSLRRCRPYSGSSAGCGCYMPFKIMMGGGCWINEEYPEEDMGWKAGLR